MDYNCILVNSLVVKLFLCSKSLSIVIKVAALDINFVNLVNQLT